VVHKSRKETRKIRERWNGMELRAHSYMVHSCKKYVSKKILKEETGRIQKTKTSNSMERI
jgi:hypothetical protein